MLQRMKILHLFIKTNNVEVFCHPSIAHLGHAMPLWMLQRMKISHLFVKAEPKSSINAAFEANSLLLHCFISSALIHQTMLECSATHQ
jgi:hypothetical protein